MRLRLHCILTLDLSLRKRQDLSPCDDVVMGPQGSVADRRDLD